jgi:hypothetical protein
MIVLGIGKATTAWVACHKKWIHQIIRQSGIGFHFHFFHQSSGFGGKSGNFGGNGDSHQI